jgi:hypothetical protein
MATRQPRSTALVPLLLALALHGCGSEESPAPTATPAPAAPPAAPAAPAPEARRAPAAPAAVPAPAAAEGAPAWTGELPADFPSDVPHYPGSKVTQAKGTQELGIAVTFTSTDGLDAVAKYYADGLAANGWQAEMQDIPEGKMIVAEKEDRQAHAIVHVGEQGTLVDMIIVRVE